MGRRAHLRMAWTMQAFGQGLGKSQSPRPRILASRVDQAHAEKAMQSNMIFPDRLSGSAEPEAIGGCVISFSSNWPLAGRRRAGQTEYEVIERLQSPLIVLVNQQRA